MGHCVRCGLSHPLPSWPTIPPREVQDGRGSRTRPLRGGRLRASARLTGPASCCPTKLTTIPWGRRQQTTLNAVGTREAGLLVLSHLGSPMGHDKACGLSVGLTRARPMGGGGGGLQAGDPGSAPVCGHSLSIRPWPGPVWGVRWAAAGDASAMEGAEGDQDGSCLRGRCPRPRGPPEAPLPGSLASSCFSGFLFTRASVCPRPQSITLLFFTTAPPSWQDQKTRTAAATEGKASRCVRAVL